jgi:lipopolysaccharide/colanic/teichoic acid biosynthesis glycosyltransferase
MQSQDATPPFSMTRQLVDPTSPNAGVDVDAGDATVLQLGLAAPPICDEAFSASSGHDTLKRVLDVVVAGVLLVALIPIVVLAATLLLIDSPGSLFFRCERVGWRGRPLRMLKFRKMHPDASGRPLTVENDQRLTRVGALLAKAKLDEVPQLWHVLRGEMSLVGPRPEDPQFVEEHQTEFASVLQVRPGLTGLSQLAFAEEGRILDDERPLEHYVDRILPQKLEMDRLYAQNRTFWLDLRILVWTAVAVVVRRPVAVNRETGAMNVRRRDVGRLAALRAKV